MSSIYFGLASNCAAKPVRDILNFALKLLGHVEQGEIILVPASVPLEPIAMNLIESLLVMFCGRHF